ncbi:hypothetical protein A0J57_18595 [Sphingobium sp. 22B]|nr:hypothetical protein AXW74_23030 [Sphingobium sp. AM]KYC30848.1 hypothetical protein A0J57_18595 [Sphingobium sp. 22B]OAP29382.1 hypothetical protein A8O16_23895 [Sphingobium sp. 20006FA]
MERTMTDHGAAQQLILRYWNALDRRDYPAMLDLLTEDVEWKVSAMCEGRAAVAAELEKRPSNMVVRHIISNIVVDDAPEGQEVFFLLTAFGRLTEDGDKPPYPLELPQILGDIRATVVERDGQLRISRIAASPVFRAAHRP